MGKGNEDYSDYLERLKRFRPIDDTFMRAMFRDSLPLAEFVLRIILGKPDLRLISCVTQADMKRVTGARSVSLDAYGTDDSGRKYDIEIQRSRDGAGAHRARYHSSVMDVENLSEGQDFAELPDTYVIFITERDYFKAGMPLYVIERQNLTLGLPFGDGAHIIYVNGTYRGDSDIGRLMHDFACSEASQMEYPLMAERTRYLKENPKGVSEMCQIMEELKEKGYNEGLEVGIEEGIRAGIEKGIRAGIEKGAVKILAEDVASGVRTLEAAAARLHLSESDFKEAAKEFSIFL